MKKLLVLMLTLMLMFTLSGCVGSPISDFEDQLSELEDNLSETESVLARSLSAQVALQEALNEALAQIDELTYVDPYAYDISQLSPYILGYVGEPSYNHISEWFETDYDLDGEVSEQESLDSYAEMLEWFDYDHIVVLTLEDVSDMQWCIDESMSDEYIDAAKYAIEYYDGIEWVNASWTVESDCSLYRFSFSWITQEELYNELYASYIDEGYSEELAVEMATDYSTYAIAYNSLSLDWENDNYYNYGYTEISFIVDSMVDMTETEKAFVALHEMSHSFGLDDIYDEEFIELTLMYGYADGQELLPVLRDFDLYNLYYIYYTEEDPVVE